MAPEGKSSGRRPGRAATSPGREPRRVLREVPLVLPWAVVPTELGRVLPLIPTGSLSHSPEALQEGHVAQSLSELGQCSTAQREMAEAGGEEARGGLGITGVHHRCRARPHPVLRPWHSAIPRDLQDSHLHPHGVATLHKTKPHETPKGRLSARAKATRAAGLCSESHWTRTAGQASQRAQSELRSRPSTGLGAVLRGGTSCRHFADEVQRLRA